jgi:hypothetical protein
LTKEKVIRRTPKSSSEIRRLFDVDKQNVANTSFINFDNVESINEIKAKLSNYSFPSDVKYLENRDANACYVTGYCVRSTL